MDDANRGAAALSARDFQGAYTAYTLALSSNPKAVNYYIQRSKATAHIPSAGGSLGALRDAETALVLARARGIRELIGRSQQARATALNRLGRLADAKACWEWTQKVFPNEAVIDIALAKIAESMKGLKEGSEAMMVTVNEVPDETVEEVLKEQQKAYASGDAEAKAAASTPAAAATTTSSFPISAQPQSTAAPSSSQPASNSTPVPAGVVQTPPSKIRHEWYQSASTITVSLMVKGVPKDRATITIEPGSIGISFPLPTGSDYEFALDPLFARIDPTQSSYKILGTKIELSLKKVEAARKWHALEGIEAIDGVEKNGQGDENAASGQTAVASAAAPTTSAPAYPTSSKHGPKNWDKLASELTTKKKKKDTTEKDTTTDQSKFKANDSATEKLQDPNSHVEDDEEEGATYESDEEGDPVNGFFKKLYKNADPDTRRAMIKSYTESNGTTLSTNWSEIGKGKTETSPPDGMVAKEWGKD